MENQTMLSEFILHGLSDIPNMWLPLFLLFFFIYLMTLTGNLLILFLIITDSHLHTPMYFFLGNLASLDVCYSSVTSPHMLYDFFREKETISFPACITQVFFFIFFIGAEVSLLTVMSYDRYIAICHPLHYVQIMHSKRSVKLTSAAWTTGFLYSLIHTLFIKKLTFCGSHTIQNFFCDLPQLFQLSCTDTFLNIVLIFVFGGVLGLGSFLITLTSYIFICITLWRIPTKLKGFSTCVSHLMVVSIFYGTLFFYILSSKHKL
ncbi:hypothetical protein FKM82_022959 [Ascaphus truei]